MKIKSQQYFTGLLLIFTVFCLASCSFSRKGLVSVPDLRGISLEEAKQLARQKGLKVIVSESGFFPSVKKDFVVTQTPFPNTNVKKDRTISLQISKGPEYVKVPKLIGMEFGSACELLTKLNLYIQEITEDVNGKLDIGYVTKQVQSPGSEVLSGSGISITISKPGLPSVPNLIDIPLEDAKSMIISSGYLIGTIIFKESPSHARGVVTVQEPVPNSPAQGGSIINLIVNEKP